MNEQLSIKKVLVTGAYGLIGNLVYARLAEQPEKYDLYGSSRRTQPSERAEKIPYTIIPPERLRIADLSDFKETQEAVAGMEVVIHMAADASGRNGWESVLKNNIMAAHNLFEACRLAGVKRVIYASTNQVVFGYVEKDSFKRMFSAREAPLDLGQIKPIDHTRPTRPLNEYACSKVFGEALAHMYSSDGSMSCIVLRIGWVVAEDRPRLPNGRMLWCSQRDCVQLVERCVNAAEDLRFDIFFVQSDNASNLVDIQHARDVLGYTPQDRAEDYPI
jgi:nucleoside-diphosphate-sugar epimerase